jgi:hypothetical protein
MENSSIVAAVGPLMPMYPGPGEVMKHETSRGGAWSALFAKHHSQLTEVAEILLHRSGSPDEIVQTAFAELEHRPFYEPFGKISAVRAVVKAAVAHNYISVDSWILTTSSGAINDEHPGPQPLEALPWAERAVYFLHEVLHYSQRDIAVLLGISDAHVDNLNWLARKSMGIPVEILHGSRQPHLSAQPAGRSLHSMAFASYE